MWQNEVLPSHAATIQRRGGHIWHCVAFKRDQDAVDAALTDGMEGTVGGTVGGGNVGPRCCSHLHVYSSAAGKVQRLFVCI